MADGCYDLDGKCTVCGEYHPCSCENTNNESEEQEVKDRMKQTKQIVKDLIEQGIVHPDEIAKRSGLSKNRVYELRKELGYSKKQLKKLGLQEKKQAQAKQVSNPVIQEPEQKPQEQVATTEPSQIASNGAEKPNLEDVRYFIPPHNGDHKYVERKIGKKTDMEILDALYKAKMPTLIIGETGITTNNNKIEYWIDKLGILQAFNPTKR